MIYQREWLNLVRMNDRSGTTRFALDFYIPTNRRFSKTIALAEDQAFAIWNEIRDLVPKHIATEDKKTWVKSRVVSPPRRKKRIVREVNLTFSKTELGQKMEQYCRTQWTKPIGRASKNSILRICRELEKLSGRNASLTNATVKKYFTLRMNPERHLSPETLKCDKTEIRRLAIWLGIKDLDGLFKDVYIPSASQLKDHGIKFQSHNRRHLERPEVQKFVDSLLRADVSDFPGGRDSIIIQLLLGSRPQEAPCAEILASSLVIGASWSNGRQKSLKTARKGVQTIIVPRNPVINGILFLTGCNPRPIATEKASDFFQQVAKSALGRSARDLDRYCLRHTALTWLLLSPGFTQKEVGDMAGHMGSRMLQDSYASRRVKDQRPWEEAMPLAVRTIPRTWHGFLLECVMVSLWPDLAHGKKPNNDPRFTTLRKILNNSGEKRAELDLF